MRPRERSRAGRTSDGCEGGKEGGKEGGREGEYVMSVCKEKRI